MPEPPDRLHQRFLQQAVWTKAIRDRAFAQFGLPGLKRILEVGSGTGAIASELQSATNGLVVGLDCDPRATAFARAADRRTAYVTGLGQRLPFPAGSFDLSCCHFLLLWVADPLAVLLEMRRVTRPGGGVLCLAEPDYGGRVEYPEDLAELGALQEDALRAQGADTHLGRRLRALFHQAGLAEVQAGVLGGEWRNGGPGTGRQHELEWLTLAGDLAGRVSAATLRKAEAVVKRSQVDGHRVLFVPTFYAWGTCPLVPIH